MYKLPDKTQLSFVDFYLPFGGKLDPSNRWIKMSVQIPWDEIEAGYAKLFGDTGNPAKTCRIAFGSLLIQKRLKLTDEETVKQITENPYLQYFIGLPEYTTEPPFAASSLVNFRKRFSAEKVNEINEEMFIRKRDNDNNDDSEPPPNNGTLILDATCAPADIPYPTDLDLLNEARETTEKIIDVLHKPDKGKKQKPRTNRRKARKAYLNLAKRKKKTKKQIRKGIRQQLGYVRRNLDTIGKYDCRGLSKRHGVLLGTIQKVYEQQKFMYDNKTHSVPDRIVNIYQPHVRPIVRGKAGVPVEFGAKVSLSVVNGYSFVDEIGWDNFNEGAALAESVENYRRRFGCYPAEVIADKLYRSADNLRFCKSKGIRLSGPKLGRPSRNHSEELKLERADYRVRNQIEGKFGEAKRKYGLNLIMTKLPETGETDIALIFLVMNLERRLRTLLRILGFSGFRAYRVGVKSQKCAFACC